MKHRPTDKVRAAVAGGNWKEALKIAKDFRINVTAKQREEMTRAYECIVHPDFYRQIGVNISEAVEKGKAIVEALYGPERAVI